MNIPAKPSAIRVDRKYYQAPDGLTLSPLMMTGIIRPASGRSGLTHPYRVIIWPQGRLPGRADQILARSGAEARRILFAALTPGAAAPQPAVMIPAQAEPAIIAEAAEIVRAYEARRPAQPTPSRVAALIADFATQSALTLAVITAGLSLIAALS